MIHPVPYYRVKGVFGPEARRPPLQGCPVPGPARRHPLRQGWRTVTSWLRAAGVTADFRNAYTTVCATGHKADLVAISTWQRVRPLLGTGRLRLAIDDTPTARYGPEVEGAGLHHAPATPEWWYEAKPPGPH